MSMQHIYQPVMIIELLKNQGNATEETIARVILNRDPTQIDYYSDGWVLKCLLKGHLWLGVSVKSFDGWFKNKLFRFLCFFIIR